MAQKPPQGRTRPAMRQAEKMMRRETNSRVRSDGSTREPTTRATRDQVPGQMDVWDCLIETADDERFWFES